MHRAKLLDRQLSLLRTDIFLARGRRPRWRERRWAQGLGELLCDECAQKNIDAGNALRRVAWAADGRRFGKKSRRRVPYDETLLEHLNLTTR
jgi:hypothetical protein